MRASGFILDNSCGSTQWLNPDDLGVSYSNPVVTVWESTLAGVWCLVQQAAELAQHPLTTLEIRVFIVSSLSTCKSTQECDCVDDCSITFNSQITVDRFLEYVLGVNQINYVLLWSGRDAQHELVSLMQCWTDISDRFTNMSPHMSSAQKQ